MKPVRFKLRTQEFYKLYSEMCSAYILIIINSLKLDESIAFTQTRFQFHTITPN